MDAGNEFRLGLGLFTSSSSYSTLVNFSTGNPCYWSSFFLIYLPVAENKFMQSSIESFPMLIKAPFCPSAKISKSLYFFLFFQKIIFLHFYIFCFYFFSFSSYKCCYAYFSLFSVRTLIFCSIALSTLTKMLKISSLFSQFLSFIHSNTSSSSPYYYSSYSCYY